jgi:ubiquinone/menaquinone biosynthesis C-methylase UbiE
MSAPDGDQARSFDRVADAYQRARPSYPAAAVHWALEPAPGRRVVDLAAGTGKLTEVLVAAGAEVVAVEPLGNMRAELERALPSVRALAGAAERIPLPDGSTDAVFVGQAFHWFDAPAALAEIARVLRPRGGLVLLWNDWWETEPPLGDEAKAILREPYERSGRSFQADVYTWRDAFDGSPFEPPREEKLANEVVVPAGDLAALYCSTSSIASLPEAERSALRGRLLAHLSGEYRLPIEVELVWTRLR